MKVLLYIGMVLGISTSGLLASDSSPSFSLAEEYKDVWYPKKKLLVKYSSIFFLALPQKETKNARLKNCSTTTYPPHPLFSQAAATIDNMFLDVDRVAWNIVLKQKHKSAWNKPFNRSQNLSPPLEGVGGRKINTTTLPIKKDTLPSIEALYTCLETHHQHLLTAELAEYQETTKGEWLKYIPSVGVTYTINNQPRPSVSFSTSTIYQARKNKQLRAAKRNAIQQARTLELSVAKSKLASLVADYENATSRLDLAYRIHEIDRQLFEIDKAKYEQLEKAPSEWLKIQRAFLIKEQELGERERELAVLRNEVLQLARCDAIE